MCQESGGRLGSSENDPDCNSMRYASVQGSHANQVNRAILHGAKHEDTDMTINGRLSVMQVGQEWRDAIEKGTSWIIVSQD